jgi:hypothetical protein
MEIKKYNSYVRGVVGQDVQLTLRQKLKLLFCKGFTIALIEKRGEPHA